MAELSKLSTWVAPTADTRSGDRVRNGMVISGLSLATISTVVDPFLTHWMAEQTRQGYVFADPEGWKSGVVLLGVVLGTAILGTGHMLLIRMADRLRRGGQGEETIIPESSVYTTLQRELQEADAELGRLRAQMAEAQAVRADRPLTQILSHTDLPPTV